MKTAPLRFALAWLAFGAAGALAADPFDQLLKGKEDVDVEALLFDAGELEARRDLPLMRVSHLMEFEDWDGVRPAARKDQDAERTYAWAAAEEPGYSHLKSYCSRARHTVTPLAGEPIRSTVTPPEAISRSIRCEPPSLLG